MLGNRHGLHIVRPGEQEPGDEAQPQWPLVDGDDQADGALDGGLADLFVRAVKARQAARRPLHVVEPPAGAETEQSVEQAGSPDDDHTLRPPFGRQDAGQEQQN